MTGTTTTRPIGVEELRRAWRAIQDGQFRHRSPQTTARPPRAVMGEAVWSPSEPVLPIVGCVGQAGSSTVAVAVATVAGSARVLECASGAASGLAAAATAEFGPKDSGWTVGRRDRVWITRIAEVLCDVTEVPLPDAPPAAIDLTVLDLGWDPAHAMASHGWVRDVLASSPTLIAVTAPTVPGLRRLETALSLLTSSRASVAVIGPHPRRWSRPLTAAMGPLTRAVAAEGRLTPVPLDKHLALRGVDSTPLPGPVLKAAHALLQQAAVGDPHQRGHAPCT